MYRAVTQGVQITVEPRYLDEESEPKQSKYVWAYTIDIKNLGNETVQLLSRHWRITDADGVTYEVRGQGVIGEQPTLPPGETFQYTSGVPLEASSGIMMGTYEMRAESGRTFLVEIPAFSLDSPHASRVAH